MSKKNIVGPALLIVALAVLVACAAPATAPAPVAPQVIQQTVVGTRASDRCSSADRRGPTNGRSSTDRGAYQKDRRHHLLQPVL